MKEFPVSWTGTANITETAAANSVDSKTTRVPFGPVLPRHIFLLISLAMIWGTSFLVMKIGVQHMPALPLTAVRLIVAAIVMVMAAMFLHKRYPRGWLAWAFCFTLAFFGNSLPFFLISWGVGGIASGRAAILMAVMPLATMVLAHFFSEGDRLRSHKLFGVTLGFAGIVVLVGPAAVMGLGGSILHQLATASGAICYAISVIIVQRMPPAPMMGRAALTLVFAALQTAPVAFWLSGWQMPALTFNSLWPPLYLGLFSTALATLILFKLLSEREASFVAFQNYLVPVFGVFWGALLLGEEVSLQAIMALGLILLGIFIANRRQRG
ncbi:DMT family transporter [Thalassospiraceae bacterium LMO-JJ14]|nr:DMT family transporter [Thalassospiraceae bacterium LMO-JJ14]